ncbi:globin domain-containing protein [Stackebrandtia soli]|uniref:globin domain-containing protein n=1 Tax=Stackebrandtia soli TaxID=1892856 RepID=UPI0039EAFB72
MLSPQSIPVVRATLPVIGAAIDEIAELFYAKLFADRPELLRDVFNRGNQANGEQRRALAGSIAAFAAMLVNDPDTRPDVMLARIANKHASLGITASQYKLVHRHLFAAIGEVLGEAVTEAVAAAWDEVYWLMANSLIALESRLYRAANVADGEIWRQMTIVEHRSETSDVTSFALVRTDGEPAGDYQPGQYVSVQVELPDGARQIRQYSLSHAPGNPQWRITVKRVRDGVDPDGEVSSWLHANATVGDVLTVSAPFGELVLPPGDEAPLLIASAGIGVTPMIAMLEHLVSTGSSRPVTVIHADRAPSAHALREEQERCVAALPNARLLTWYEEPREFSGQSRTGRVDLSDVDLPKGLIAYLCGPLPFMRDLRANLLLRGVPARDIHYEVFGPDLWLV